MDVTTKIGTVSRIRYSSSQITEYFKIEELSFLLEYAAGQTVTVSCKYGSIVDEIRGKLKDGDKVTVIGFIDEDMVFRVFGILTEDDIVYPKYFSRDRALQCRQQEQRMQELLKASEQFADEDDPF